MKIRQPIVTVCGHVDHGKTSILDCLRNSCVQEGEAGGITQKISFTLYPVEQLKKACPLIEKSKIKLNIPGFLLVDTPGHAAFTNLRKRGGSIADLAILVIDINEGIKPQTAEVIKILKHNKTPFVIALNKIDNISGWRGISQESKAEEDLKSNIESQPQHTKQKFEQQLFMLEGALHNHGFESDLFYNIEDFSKQIALIPVSAKTQQGIPELIMMLCGLSQKYLSDKLELGKEPKGVILEIKKQKTFSYAEAILYDGELEKKHEIAVANLDIEKNSEPIVSKIRILEEIQPLCAKFKPAEKVQASTGIRMQLVEKTEILPGTPFVLYKGDKEKIKQDFKKQISDSITSHLSKQGIIAKADSLGSLEALLTLLKQEKIPVVKAGIGSINKTDVISTKVNLDINEVDAVVVGFNVLIDEDAEQLLKENNLKKLTDDVIYKLIEDLGKWRQEKANEIEKKRLMKLTTICKLKVLQQYVFRNSNPAIFGVRVEEGKLKSGLEIINSIGEKIGRIKKIQSQNQAVEEAEQGMEVAISIPGTNFERKIKSENFLYTNITESQFKIFKKNKDLLSNSEKKVLAELAEIKRKKKDGWGS